MKLCVIIPVFNESKAIGDVVRGLRQQQLDVLVIDDGSSDQSGAFALAQGAQVLFQPTQHGKGFSLKKGFEYALAKGYDAVITLDGDGQHSVGDVSLFLEKARQFPLSLITGNRMHDVRKMPVIRKLTNIFMSKIISLACRQHVPDTQCGFRYFHCDILKAIQVVTQGYEIETEMLMKAAKKGYPIYSVNIQTIYDGETSHIHPLRDACRFIIFFVKEIFSR